MRRAALAFALAAAVVGCGDGTLASDAELTVYVSLPLRGPSGADGSDAMRGAKLALADAGGEAGGVAVRGVYLDDTSGPAGLARWDPVQVAENARAATRDSTSIAYIGELQSAATRTSLPITNSARLLQVSPGSTQVGLVAPFPGSDDLPEDVQTSGERTFGRVIPDHDAAREALRAWPGARTAGPVGVIPPGTRFPLSPASRLKRGVSPAQDPSRLRGVGERFVGAFARRYGHFPGRYAAYGYEAMAVVLDSIERATEAADRDAVIDAFFETADRDSVLGAYSIDEVGNTTLDRFAGYRIVAGEPVFERALRAP